MVKPAGAVGNDAPPPATPAAYSPQFSAAQSWILSRMAAAGGAEAARAQKPPDAAPSTTAADQGDDAAPSPPAADQGGGAASPAPPGSTTMPMPAHARPSLQQRSLSDVCEAAKRFLRPYSPGLKRKRPSAEPAPDFSQSTMPMPFKARPPPPPPPPRTPRPSEPPHLARCCKCGLGSSTPHNLIVICRGCLGSVHQQCRSPAEPAEPSSEAGALCHECGMQRPSPSHQHVVEDMRRKRLAGLPPGVAPARPELVGFLAGQASDAEVRHAHTHTWRERERERERERGRLNG